jgi:hypothetical protein
MSFFQRPLFTVTKKVSLVKRTEKYYLIFFLATRVGSKQNQGKLEIASLVKSPFKISSFFRARINIDIVQTV